MFGVGRVRLDFCFCLSSFSLFFLSFYSVSLFVPFSASSFKHMLLFSAFGCVMWDWEVKLALLKSPLDRK